MQKRLHRLIGYKGIIGTALKIETAKGKVVFEGTAGEIKPKSQYFLASTTKLYTTAIIMRLRKEGKLKLEDPIANHFPKDFLKGIGNYQSKNYLNTITIKHLLGHTSGFANYFGDKDNTGESLESRLFKNLDESISLDKVIDFNKKNELKFIPGQKGKAYYSDTNFQLLGAIIENYRQEKLNKVFEKELFMPLGLQNTYAFRKSPNPNLISMRYKETQLDIPLALSSFDSDGNIVSTLNESMIFIKSFMQGKLFPESYLQEMWAKTNRIFFPLEYGVGLMKFELPRLLTLFTKFPPVYGHSGISGAFAYYSPKLDIYFTGTVNQISNPSLSYNSLLVPAIREAMKYKS